MLFTIWNFFLKNYRFTYLVIIALVLTGLVTAITLPKEANPEVKVPIGFVTTFYPGASAVDVERLITDEIEERVLGLDDLDKVTSTSQESLSVVTAEFDPSADLDDRIRALKDAVSEAEGDLPSEVDRPKTIEVSFDNFPILESSLSADLPEGELKRIAEEIQDDLESIKGVSEARVTGVRDQEVQVIVDKRKLDQFGVSIAEVIAAIQSSNFSSPVGSIETNDIRYTVRIDAEMNEPDLIGSIPVKSIEQTPIYIRDIADVRFDFAKRDTDARLSVNGEPSRSSLSINIYKKTGGDIIDISRQANEMLEIATTETYPELSYFVSIDNADEIRSELGNLLRNGMTTVLIVGLLLFIFLGWREAIIAAISIPLTFFFGFIGLSLIGSTINFLSLFSLILALGILVDTGIVITEGLHAYAKQGYEPVEAAQATIKEFQWPLIAGTLTTVSAFLPMIFMSGIMGEFVKHIPITVNLVLVGSLFVALAILPLLGSKLVKKSDTAKKDDLNDEEKVSKYLVGLQRWYKRTIRALLKSRVNKIWFVGSLIGAFFVTVILFPAFGVLSIILFPPADMDFFYIDVEAPIGTTLGQTNRVVLMIEEELYEDSRIESFVSKIGTGNAQSEESSGGTPTHLASITVNMYEDQEMSTEDILKEYREKLDPITEAEIKVTQLSSGPPTGAPVLITFEGDDLTELERLSEDAVSILEDIPGAIQISSSFKESALEFVMEVKRENASQYGLTPLQIAQTLRSAVQGTEATKIRIDGEDIDVDVKMSLNPLAIGDDTRTETSINEIEQMLITTPTGQEVALSTLVDISVKAGNTTISHLDGNRRASVTAYTQDATPQQVFAEFEKQQDELNIPDGYIVNLGGESEDLEESFRDLFQALFLGIFLIAAILLLQFNSFRQPMYIMSTLPLALIGVFTGLAAIQLPFSFPAFIGVVALSGVVVNDAIIMMDKINRNKKKGMNQFDSVVDAGVARMQPILLTTITTIAGILPLALSDPVWAGLGFSMIFGLLFATLLTLFVIPVLSVTFSNESLSRYWLNVDAWLQKRYPKFHRRLAWIIQTFRLNRIYATIFS